MEPLRKKNLSNKEIMANSIKKITKINPYWISFMQNVIQLSVVSGEPVKNIISREYKRVSKEISHLPDKDILVGYIKLYAETHFQLKVL